MLPGGVALEGAVGLHRQANLRLRTASRVLLRLGTFAATDAIHVRRGLASLDWARVVASGTRPAVEVTGSHPHVSPSAIEKVVAQTWPPSAPLGPELQLRGLGDRLEVSVDTSGELLYRRGYRHEVGHAPLRETLAAGGSWRWSNTLH